MGFESISKPINSGNNHKKSKWHEILNNKLNNRFMSQEIKLEKSSYQKIPGIPGRICIGISAY